MATHATVRKVRGKTTAARSVKRRDAGTEQNLLVATADLLTEKGNLDFTLAEVGAKADLSTALVQYYFGSKHGLLNALLEWSSSQHVAQLNFLMAMDISAMEKLRIHVRGIVKTYTKTPWIDRLLHHLIDASDDAEAQKISDFYVKRVVVFYQRLIDQGVKEGAFRPVDPVHLYFILLGTGDHLAARRRLLAPLLGSRSRMDANFVDDFGGALYDIMLNGLRKV